MAFDDDWDADNEDREYFDASLAQGHLLIIRAFDAPQYYRSENNPDGMVHPGRGKDFEPFPNTVVRCAVADLDAEGGAKIYPESVLFPFSITKVAKNWIGKGPQLLMWRKTGPKQTDPYELRNMRNDEQAVEVGTRFLGEHPEFMALPAPAPYDGRPPSREREDRGGRRGGDNWGDPRSDYDRDGYDRPRDRGRDAGGRRDDRGARDWGQHDERGRREPPRGYQDEDPWARPRRDDRGGDGSFLSRSRNAQGRYQDEEPPF